MSRLAPTFPWPSTRKRLWPGWPSGWHKLLRHGRTCGRTCGCSTPKPRGSNWTGKDGCGSRRSWPNWPVGEGCRAVGGSRSLGTLGHPAVASVRRRETSPLRRNRRERLRPKRRRIAGDFPGGGNAKPGSSATRNQKISVRRFASRKRGDVALHGHRAASLYCLPQPAASSRVRAKGFCPGGEPRESSSVRPVSSPQASTSPGTRKCPRWMLFIHLPICSTPPALLIFVIAGSHSRGVPATWVAVALPV